jgi:hypothetical protein
MRTTQLAGAELANRAYAFPSLGLVYAVTVCGSLPKLQVPQLAELGTVATA